MFKKIFSYRQGSLSKLSGFTLVEIMVAMFILTIIVAALYATLNTGQTSGAYVSARTDLQANVRLLMDLIVKDVRQTNLLEINSNGPSVDHIKFRKVTGIDNATGSYTVEANYIEYSYDSDEKQIIRQEVDQSGAVLESWTYGNDSQISPFYITESPFYVAEGDGLDANDILTHKKLYIKITGQTKVWNASLPDFSLAQEVKVRNE